MNGLRDPLAIIGTGAVTSVGLYPEAIAAAAAGPIARLRYVERMRHSRTGDPVLLALLETLPRQMPAAERMLTMGKRAAMQALGPLLALRDPVRLAVQLALPPERPGMGVSDVQSVARALLDSLPIPPVRGGLSAFHMRGHEGGVTALARAWQILEGDHADACLVGGVESHADPELLDWLGKRGRLKNDEAPCGIVPGEGAGFLLAVRSRVAAHYAWPRVTNVCAFGRSEEPNPWYTRRPTQGGALTRAIATALGGLREGQRAETTYCDMNGEAWRADEWAFAYLRTGDRHGEPLALRHPADCWGDVGAASFPLLCATAAVDMRKGRVPPRALIWCATDTRPHRGAALLHADLERR